MGLLSNMRIRSKILVSFLILVIITAILAVLSISILFKVDRSYSAAIEQGLFNIEATEKAIIDNKDMRIATRGMVMNAGDHNKINQEYELYKKAYSDLAQALGNYLEFAETNHIIVTPSVEDVVEEGQKFNAVAEQVYESMMLDDPEQAVALIDDAKGSTDSIANNLDQWYENSKSALLAVSSENSRHTTNMAILMAAITAFAVVMSVILGYLLSKSITKPVNRLLEASNNIVNGDLDVEISSGGKDETADLSNAMASIVSTFKAIITDIQKVSDEIEVQGDVQARLDESKYNGGYRDMAHGFNAVITGIVNDTMNAIDCAMAYSNGDFDKTIKRHIGKKVIMTQAFDKLQTNLIAVGNDINSIVVGAQAGNLDVQIDSSKYENSWAEIAKGLNNAVQSVVKPIAEAMTVISAMSQGNLKLHMSGDYKGDYGLLKDTLNNTLDTLSVYIDEISTTLHQMSNENFDIEVTGDYIGDFAPIKTALNDIVKTINMILSEVNGSAEQVSAGAKQISESSMSLAQGATEQAGAVEDLVHNLNSITDQTRKNAEDAGQANKLALITKENADVGSQEMEGMLLAMKDINEASTNISKIIKVIDDIAFQTNLLALNAAVEAARAGQHGKGFAVVAEEVRSLAARSKNAAQETTALIQGSVEKVGEGTKIANQTAETLQAIVKQITEISGLVGGVATASSKQEQDIEQINSGINKISQVTQTNTATSEEEASSSEQLSSQAEVFRNMVSRFKIKKNQNGFEQKKTNNQGNTLNLNASPLIIDVPIEQDISIDFDDNIDYNKNYSDANDFGKY